MFLRRSFILLAGAVGTVTAAMKVRSRMGQKNEMGPTYKMRTASISDGRLIMSKEDFDEAKRTGFFQIELPQNLKSDLTALRRFSKEFYKNKIGDGSKNDNYRGFNIGFNRQNKVLTKSLEEGYMIDNHKGNEITNENQVERFSLKKTESYNHWQDFYPGDIEHAAEMMNRLAVVVLIAAMKNLKIEREIWSKSTGKSIDSHGTSSLLINHYRPEIKARGLKAHKDWSNVSVLCTGKNENNRHALEAYIDGKWQRIAPSNDNCLIINFGVTLEILTQCLPKSEQIKASVHRVVQQGNNYHRSSVVLFADHAFDTPIYSLSPDKKSLNIVHEDIKAFVRRESEKAYLGSDDTWPDDESQDSSLKC